MDINYELMAHVYLFGFIGMMNAFGLVVMLFYFRDKKAPQGNSQQP